MTAFLDSLEDLETAEDFLKHFGIPYDQSVVNVNRLHILQRMHDRLATVALDAMGEGEQREAVAAALAAAYHDFVVSDARTEKVFRVFQQAERGGTGRTVVPLADIRGVGSRT